MATSSSRTSVLVAVIAVFIQVLSTTWQSLPASCGGTHLHQNRSQSNYLARFERAT
jgi:hypothetical protein